MKKFLQMNLNLCIKMKTQFDEWSKEDFIKEIIILRRNRTQIQNKYHRLNVRCLAFEKEIEEARKINADFEYQIELQVSLQTHQVASNYIKFVETITKMLELMKENTQR